jgi:hypothetical protein
MQVVWSFYLNTVTVTTEEEEMVRDLAAERRSLLNELPTDLAACVERNRIWMDTFGGDRGLTALTQANKEEEETKVCEPVVQEEKEEEENHTHHRRLSGMSSTRMTSNRSLL